MPCRALSFNIIVGAMVSAAKSDFFHHRGQLLNMPKFFLIKIIILPINYLDTQNICTMIYRKLFYHTSQIVISSKSLPNSKKKKKKII